MTEAFLSSCISFVIFCFCSSISFVLFSIQIFFRNSFFLFTILTFYSIMIICVPILICILHIFMFILTAAQVLVRFHDVSLSRFVHIPCFKLKVILLGYIICIPLLNIICSMFYSIVVFISITWLSTRNRLMRCNVFLPYLIHYILVQKQKYQVLVDR